MPKPTELQFKAGVRVKPPHFLPHASVILTVALETAPNTTDGIVWITEAYREPQHPTDLHPLCLAFDLRVHNITCSNREAGMSMASEWVRRQRGVHADPYYQFELHGDIGEKPDDWGDLHIHAEFDPR